MDRPEVVKLAIESKDIDIVVAYIEKLETQVENFEKSLYSSQESYYEKYPYSFMKDYFGVELKWHQKLVIKFMNMVDSLKKLFYMEDERRNRK